MSNYTDINPQRMVYNIIALTHVELHRHQLHDDTDIQLCQTSPTKLTTHVYFHGNVCMLRQHMTAPHNNMVSTRTFPTLKMNSTKSHRLNGGSTYMSYIPTRIDIRQNIPFFGRSTFPASSPRSTTTTFVGTTSRDTSRLRAATLETSPIFLEDDRHAYTIYRFVSSLTPTRYTSRVVLEFYALSTELVETRQNSTNLYIIRPTLSDCSTSRLRAAMLDTCFHLLLEDSQPTCSTSRLRAAMLDTSSIYSWKIADMLNKPAPHRHARRIFHLLLEDNRNALQVG